LKIDSRTIITNWNKLASVPGGKTLFNMFMKKFVPYTGSLGSEIHSLSPGRAEIHLKDRRSVRNHLNSVHAMALANLGEYATGMAIMSALPPGMRGILLSFEIEYLKKARGDLRAHAEYTKEISTTKQDLEVIGEILDSSGQLVTKVKAIWRVDIDNRKS
jgi:acyl-coenzyme A thioesterase PaaI-like protein